MLLEGTHTNFHIYKIMMTILIPSTYFEELLKQWVKIVNLKFFEICLKLLI